MNNNGTIHIPTALIGTIVLLIIALITNIGALTFVLGRQDAQIANINETISAHERVPAHSNIDVRVTRIETLLGSE